MVKFALKLMVVGVIGWTGYIAAQACWTYYATQAAVDRALLEAAAVYRTPLSSRTFTEAMLADVRYRVERDAARDRFPVQAEDVGISATGTGFAVTIRYSLPLITHSGKDFLTVPVSLRRSPEAGLSS
jgi:hypothetical protein